MSARAMRRQDAAIDEVHHVLPGNPKDLGGTPGADERVHGIMMAKKHQKHNKNLASEGRRS